MHDEGRGSTLAAIPQGKKLHGLFHSFKSLLGGGHAKHRAARLGGSSSAGHQQAPPLGTPSPISPAATSASPLCNLCQPVPVPAPAPASAPSTTPAPGTPSVHRGPSSALASKGQQLRGLHSGLLRLMLSQWDAARAGGAGPAPHGPASLGSPASPMALQQPSSHDKLSPCSNVRCNSARHANRPPSPTGHGGDDHGPRSSPLPRSTGVPLRAQGGELGTAACGAAPAPTGGRLAAQGYPGEPSKAEASSGSLLSALQSDGGGSSPGAGPTADAMGPSPAIWAKGDDGAERAECAEHGGGVGPFARGDSANEGLCCSSPSCALGHTVSQAGSQQPEATPVPVAAKGLPEQQWLPVEWQQLLAAPPQPSTPTKLVVLAPPAAAVPAGAAPPAGARALPDARPLRRAVVLGVNPSVPPAMWRREWSLEDYQVTKRMHKGETSAVYRATCLRSRAPVALKVYFLSKVIHMIQREIALHISLVHRNIITLYAAFQDERHIVLVQEYAARGDLHSIQNIMGRLTETQVTELVLVPFLRACAHLHAHGIIHRDIKPENILFSAGWQLKVADFGVSICAFHERAVTRTGTPDYMAPEVQRCPLKHFAEENKDNAYLAYTNAIDIWSAGVLAYELLVGFPPCMDANAQGPPAAARPHGALTASATTQLSLRKPLRFPASMSAHARDFIAAALAEKPEDRPTCRELLRHPWLVGAVQALQKEGL